MQSHLPLPEHLGFLAEGGLDMPFRARQDKTGVVTNAQRGTATNARRGNLGRLLLHRRGEAELHMTDGLICQSRDVGNGLLLFQYFDRAAGAVDRIVAVAMVDVGRERTRSVRRTRREVAQASLHRCPSTDWQTGDRGKCGT